MSRQMLTRDEKAWSIRSTRCIVSQVCRCGSCTYTSVLGIMMLADGPTRSEETLVARVGRRGFGCCTTTGRSSSLVAGAVHRV